MALFFTILALFGFLVAGISAIVVLARNPGAGLNRLFFLFATAVALRNFLEIIIKVATSLTLAEALLKLTVLSWLLFVAGLLHFSLVLADQRRTIIRAVCSLVYGSALVIGLVHWTSGYFYSGIGLEPWGLAQQYGRGYWLLASYSIVLFLGAIYYAGLAWSRERSVRGKKQKAVIFFSFVLTFIPAFVFEALFRVIGLHLPPMIQSLPVVIIIFFAYAMVRYGLLTISPHLIADSVITTMPNILLVADQERRVFLANPQARRQLGYAEKELLGRPLHDLLGEAEVAGLGDRLDGGLEKRGELQGRRVLLRIKSGEVLPFSLDASAALDRFGDRLGWVLIFRDVSEEEKMLRQQREAIAELTRTRERMVSILEDVTASRDQEKKLYEELKTKIGELEDFHRVAVGRELKMIELEKELERYREGGKDEGKA